MLSLAAALLAIAVGVDTSSRSGTQLGSFSASVNATCCARPLGWLRFFWFPALLAMGLFVMVAGSTNGTAARGAAFDYWKQNYATWNDAPQPSVASANLDLWLDPATSAFRTKGSFRLHNHHQESIDRFALSGGPHWQEVRWTVDGESVEPENRSLLYVFSIENGLRPGQEVTVGFELEGRQPDGISEKGRELAEFILPSGVVLTSLNPTFAPTVGFRP